MFILTFQIQPVNGSAVLGEHHKAKKEKKKKEKERHRDKERDTEYMSSS